MPAATPAELTPGDWAVLGAVAERPTHGFAIAQLLAPDGALGEVWTVPRPVVYQSLKKLTQLGLVTERTTERSERGPLRTILAVTPSGRRHLRRWSAQPVDHVRDVRSMLLMKLALLDRAGTDHRGLLEAQRRKWIPQLEALEQARDRAEGFERVVTEWRLASSRAAIEFLDAVSPPADLPNP